jgi:hypothetical protein
VLQGGAHGRRFFLKDRLAENEAHRQSIAEKHQYAREALERYRQSVKAQRDQDQRRHEQQIQQSQAEMRLLQQSLVVKQDATQMLVLELRQSNDEDIQYCDEQQRQRMHKAVDKRLDALFHRRDCYGGQEEGLAA